MTCFTLFQTTSNISKMFVQNSTDQLNHDGNSVPSVQCEPRSTPSDETRRIDGSKGVFGLFVFSPPLPLRGNTNFGTRRGILDSWDTPSIQLWQYAWHPVPCVKNTLKKQNRFWNCMELCSVVQPTPPKQQSLITQLWPPCSRHRNSFCYKWMFLSVITS